MYQSIGDRVQHVHERIQTAAQRVGRSSTDVTLIGVSKTHSVELIDEAIAAGIHHLGESRVQEAGPKQDALARHSEVCWHMIGHLQRNKANQAIRVFDMLHSLDSLRLAQALSRHMQETEGPALRPLDVLLQINISGEASKEGFDLAGGLDDHVRLNQFFAVVEEILVLPGLKVQGLMTIAPWGDTPEATRPIFRQLYEVRERLAQRFGHQPWPHLSMGMTDDFEVAIEEGATLIRVGRAIFGARPRP